jgi:two-component system sensor histidine kinase MtrB
VDPLIVETAPRRLARILANLLDTAGEHARASDAEVTADTPPGELVITVADRGPGVPEGAIEHLFERFYKADASRAAGSSGLGLAIAMEHATLLGGGLRAGNRDGGGLVVELRLPVTGSLRGGDLSAIGRNEDGDVISATPETHP